MSVATSAQYSPARAVKPDEPTEPFGQAGIFQYAGRLIAWTCLTVALCALAMGHRSGSYSDLLRWRGRDQVIDVLSGNGRLLVSTAVFRNRTFTNDTGWKYAGSYDRWWPRQLAEPARDWGGVGLEGGNSSQLRGADSGFWVRVSWPLIAALFMIQPVVWVVRRLISRRPRRPVVA